MIHEFEIVSAGATALVGGFSVLWRQITASSRRTEERLKASEEKVQETHDQITTLNRTVGLLEGRQQGIEQLSDRVLDAVRLAVG
jgi:hypothetical protein